MISFFFNHVSDRRAETSDSSADFFRQPVFAISWSSGQRVEPGDLEMNSIAPFLSQLSVVAAYLAFAFVGAIVLGVI